MATHDQVAHDWAHKIQRHTKGPNMFHDGETVYSYGTHFPIARHATTADGAHCILFTTRSYSVTTSKHMTQVHRAIPVGVTVFYVNDVLTRALIPSPGERTDSKPAHRKNYNLMLKEMEELVIKSSRARTRAYDYLRSLEELRARANAYTKAFKLGYKPLPEDMFSWGLPEITERVKERTLKAAKAKRAKERKDVIAWVRGEKSTLRHTDTPYVRIVGEELQTSWGIRVPLNRALAVYRLATLCRKNGHTYIPRKRQLIGTWALDGITSDGTVRAGCHIIPYRVQKEAAKLSGVL